MTRALTLGAAAVAALCAVLLAGGADWLADQSRAMQREVQESLAFAIRAIRAGEPGALAALLGLCFGYGFFHAVGPGHGKILIGAYGVARDVPLLRLSGLALASSLGQAVVAIALVYGAIGFLGWTRTQIGDLADRWMAALSYGAIALIGLWLVLRGLRRVVGWMRAAQPHHVHAPAPDGVCATCGHSHGPTIAQARATTTPREALSLIGAVAIRPCTGALFLLVLTWQFGIAAAGVMGAVAMALGTASVSIAVAVAAVTVRAGAVARLAEGLGDGRQGARVIGGVEILAGALVMLVAVPLAMATV